MQLYIAASTELQLHWEVHSWKLVSGTRNTKLFGKWSSDERRMIHGSKLEGRINDNSFATRNSLQVTEVTRFELTGVCFFELFTICKNCLKHAYCYQVVGESLRALLSQDSHTIRFSPDTRSWMAFVTPMATHLHYAHCNPTSLRWRWREFLVRRCCSWGLHAWGFLVYISLGIFLKLKYASDL